MEFNTLSPESTGDKPNPDLDRIWGGAQHRGAAVGGLPSKRGIAFAKGSLIDRFYVCTIMNRCADPFRYQSAVLESPVASKEPSRELTSGLFLAICFFISSGC